MLMNKEEFYNYIVKEYFLKTDKEKEMLMDILNKGEGMEESEQYLYLSNMLPFISDSDLKKVFY